MKAIQLPDELTPAERDRLSRPFPPGRTDEDKFSDMLLAMRAARIHLTKIMQPEPNPMTLAARGLVIGAGASTLTLAILLLVSYLIR